MKKHKSLILAIILFTPLYSSALLTYQNPLGGITTIPAFVQALLAMVVKIGIPVASIFLIWSGFLFITAQGNETKLTTAKKTFVWTCIGIGVFLGAWLFAVAFNQILGNLMVA